jgi:hypothetical protein
VVLRGLHDLHLPARPRVLVTLRNTVITYRA